MQEVARDAVVLIRLPVVLADLILALCALVLADSFPLAAVASLSPAALIQGADTPAVADSS